MAHLLSKRKIAATSIYLSVITLIAVALTAELLPEVHAKPIVISALASALVLLAFELNKIRQKDDGAA